MFQKYPKKNLIKTLFKKPHFPPQNSARNSFYRLKKGMKQRDGPSGNKQRQRMVNFFSFYNDLCFGMRDNQHLEVVLEAMADDALEELRGKDEEVDAIAQANDDSTSQSDEEILWKL